MNITTFPLRDGQRFLNQRGKEETVMGEISIPHEIPGGICYTLQGNWYRRSDGERMTAIAGEVISIKEAGEKLIQLEKRSR